MRRVLHHILTILRFGPLPNAMCYDCACTLKLFVNKHFGSDDLKSTDFTKFLTSLTMAINRFHVRNHKRAMCKTIYVQTTRAITIFLRPLIPKLPNNFSLICQNLRIHSEDITILYQQCFLRFFSNWRTVQQSVLANMNKQYDTK